MFSTDLGWLARKTVAVSAMQAMSYSAKKLVSALSSFVPREQQAPDGLAPPGARPLQPDSPATARSSWAAASHASIHLESGHEMPFWHHFLSEHDAAHLGAAFAAQLSSE